MFWTGFFIGAALGWFAMGCLALIVFWRTWGTVFDPPCRKTPKKEVSTDGS